MKFINEASGSTESKSLHTGFLPRVDSQRPSPPGTLYYRAMPLAIVFVFVVTCELLLALDHGPIIQVTAQPGFVSIDCGGSRTSYSDAETRLSWTSDSHGFGLENVSRAVNMRSPAKYPWLSSMRIFEGNQSKYCYEFDYDSHRIVQSDPYLVRASFWIGDELPFFVPGRENIHFQLLINADEWDSIDISLPQKEPLVMEMYVLAVQTTISVCVAGQGETAFISSLELRLLAKTFTSVSEFMVAQHNISMFLYSRLDLGSAKEVRYPDDAYDRIWSADTRKGYLLSSTPLSLSTTASIVVQYVEQPPSVVLQSALVNNASFNITFDGFSRSYDFFFMIFYAEISNNVSVNERVFGEEIITAAGVQWSKHNVDMALEPDKNNAYFNDELLPVDAGGFLTFSFERNSTSSLGPLVNALELLYSSQGPMSLGAYDDDVNALKFIKGKLSRFDSWRGDPCLPYSYEWLTCNPEIRPRIIKLSLQNRNITTEIPTEIGSLKALVEINLQGNNLTGSIPESIAQLPNLKTLFLQDNNLSGAIPQGLLDKKVDLRLAGNPILCKDNNATYCDQQPILTKPKERSRKSYKLIVAILAPTCAVVLILLASIFIFHSRRKHKYEDAVAITHTEVIKYANLAQHFTHQQIKRMTNDFNKKLGAGGFGNVFFGMLSTGLNVAVKVSSCQGRAQEGSEFLNEVALLSRVHHKNLVEFIGYCIEPLVLVYEYMAKGSLANYLRGKNNLRLSWRDRLKIVVGAAQGLEYLHKGCKPPIIHRDVKCSNILLDEELEGKISDFGISRSKLADTHTTVTNVQGTIGYIAPEYAGLRITEKVDIFAFGVVLLEVVSGRRPFEGSQHIIDWVTPLLNQSQIQDIVDPSIAADYNISSMWKVLEVAMACVEEDAQRRPDMHEVSSDLNLALSFELKNESVIHADDYSDLPFDTSNALAS